MVGPLRSHAYPCHHHHTRYGVLGTDTRANSVELFKTRPKLTNVQLVFKCFTGDCPPYLTDMLKSNLDIRSRSSRYGCKNLVSLVKLKGVYIFGINIAHQTTLRKSHQLARSEIIFLNFIRNGTRILIIFNNLVLIQYIFVVIVLIISYIWF